ncbi:MAG: PaaI family thioesterase [Nitrospirae bacterium]|jgi:uncharacterized protein (TIGR00369 family)|nr:PaaI family thioesterase [Nitrospirota bacterium]
MKKSLEDDHHCFVCGEKNPQGLRVRFSLQDDKVKAEFIPQKVHQGYKDIIHGGIISTLLDEAMVKTALMQGMPAVTAKITIRFKNPLMSGEKSIVEAEIIKINKRMIETSAIIKKTDGTVVAESYAKLLRKD